MTLKAASGECSGDEGGRDGGGEEIATGPSECETCVLAASYRQGSANSHESTVFALGGDEEGAGAATAAAG